MICKSLSANPQLGKYFAGTTTETKEEMRQLAVDQFCAVTGGPCVYLGRIMKLTNAGITINEPEWRAAVKELAASLDKFKVPPKERGEVLATVTRLKGDVME